MPPSATLRSECSDASECGAGACRLVGPSPKGQMYKLVSRSVVLGLLRRAEHRGTDVRVDRQQPLRAKAWPGTLFVLSDGNDKTHSSSVGLHKMRILTSLRCAPCSRLYASYRNFGQRFALLVDSPVVLWLVCKGAGQQSPPDFAVAPSPRMPSRFRILPFLRVHHFVFESC